MAATYKPTEAEKDRFDDLLRQYVAHVADEGGDFTADDLRVIAEHIWPDKNVRVKHDGLGIGWVESNPDLAGDNPETPAAAAQQPVAAVEEQTPELPEATLHKLAEGIKDPVMRRILENAKPMISGGLGGTTVVYGPEGIRSVDGHKPTADERVTLGPSRSLRQANETRAAEQLRQANVPEDYTGPAAEAPGYGAYGSKAWGEQVRAGREGSTADPLAAVKRRLMGARWHGTQALLPVR